MKVIIDDNAKLSEIQNEFSKRFPFLKLEFFGFEPDEKRKFSKENKINDLSKTIGEIRHYHVPGSIHIDGWEKVSTLEEQFSEFFGLNVQVFRKAANVWLLTTTTDDWTLNKQNEVGAEMDQPVVTKVDPADDAVHEQS